MSIKSSSLITDSLLLDDTKPSSVKTAPDRTADRPGWSDGAHARDGLVAPPGLLTHHARTQPPTFPADLQNSMAIDQHYWMATGSSQAATQSANRPQPPEPPEPHHLPLT